MGLTSDDIRAVLFSRVPGLRGGYRCRDVDDLIARLAAAFDARYSAADVIAATQLPRKRAGYDADEVDAFLDFVRAEDALRPGVRPAPVTTAGGAPTGSAPSPFIEKPSLWRRLRG